MKKIYSLLIIALCVFTANAQQVDRSIRPSAGPAKEINIKDAEIFTLSNGLKVFVVQDKTTPIAYYSLMLDVMPELEGNKAGLHSLFGEVFGKTTKKRSKEQLFKDLDMIGAQGYTHINGGYLQFLLKYHDQALEIMSDILLNPVFNQEEFDLGMSKYKTALQSIGDDPGSINSRVSGVLTYGKGMPYGEIETEQSLDNVNLNDLEHYYKTYFAPNVARLVIVGDISVAEAKAKAEKYFGKWQRKNVPAAKYVIPQAPAHNKIAFINKPGAVQSSIDISYPVQFVVGVPDYDAARVMGDIFGGSGTGRLFLNLREDKSWTYGVYGNLSPDEHIGRFNISSGRGAASIKRQATDSAVYEVLYEMRRIMNEPVSESELSSAKAYRTGSFSRSLENSSTIANFAINIDKYNLPKDYYKNYLKRLDAITVADVQAAARKYLKPDNAWIVVTADKEYADGLAPFAPDGKVQWYDINANPIETPVAQEAGISAQQIIDNYVAAMGGKAALDKVEDYVMLGEMTMMGQPVSIAQYFKKPNLTATVVTMGDMVIQKVAFDGTTLRMSGMQGNQDFTEGEEFEQAKLSAGLCPEMNYIANGYTLSVEGIEKVGDKDAYVMKVTKGESTTTEYYDVATGLKMRSVLAQEMMGQPVSVITDVSDYRDVSGVKIPFSMKVTQSAMGQTMEMDTKIGEAEINKGLDNSLFK